MRKKYTLWSSLIVGLIASSLVVSEGFAVALPTVYAPTIKESSIGPSSTITVNVNVSQATGVYGWSFYLYFNPSILQALSVVPGDFFVPEDWEGAWGFNLKISNTPTGYVTAAGYFDPQIPVGLDGSGTMASINFKVVSRGVTLLDLTNTKLNTIVAGNNVPIEHVVEDGVFDNRFVNLPPVALFSVTPPIGIVGTTFTFDASASHDDGWIASYFWNFGDGTDATGKGVQKTWGAGTEGTYSVTLTVTDNDGVSTSAQYTLTVLGWIQTGNHPDLVQTLIWLEHPVFKEADFGVHETLWARVGNPTDKSYKVRVDFQIISKDEGRKLGTISTGNATIDKHEIKDIPADFFLQDDRWKVTTGPYDWPYWVKKYWAIGQCFYLNETSSKWEAGIFPGANQFKIHPVVHDRAILAMSSSSGSNPIKKGDTVAINVIVANEGEQIEYNCQVSVHGDVMHGYQPTLPTQTTTLAVGANQTLTFYLTTANLAPGTYVLIAEINPNPYERDFSDNVMYLVIAVA